MEHDLKIEVPHYYAIRDGRKTFEARRNDRPYAEGDTLVLRPFDRATAVYVPDLPPLRRLVSHLQVYGMADGYVGLSLKEVRTETRRGSS